MVVEGIDLSDANGPVLFQAVRDSGRRFVYRKANTGEGKPERGMRQAILDANAVGLLTGVYQYAQPDLDPEDDVLALLQAIDGLQLDLRPALDIEGMNGRNPTQVADWLEGWFYHAYNRFLKAPVLYTGPAFWHGMGKEGLRPGFSDWRLWLSHYGVSKPADVPPWGKPFMWQYRANTCYADGSYGPKPKTPGARVIAVGGRCPGVATECDLNSYAGFYDDFRVAHGLPVAALSGMAY